jgi:diguanylate cyclase (GGDEF)-like protein
LLNSTLELDEVLNRILVLVGKVVPHDAANIMLIEGDLCRIVRMQGYRERGLDQSVKALEIKPSELSNLRVMMASGEPLVIQETTGYPGWVTFPVTSWIRSYASAPILVNGQVAGFLNLDSASPGFYGKIHGERLMAFANQAALAIHNAQLYERVQQMALTDELTGLYNRRGLLQLGQREIERTLRFAHPLSILMLDIDNFKKFNDNYSYKVGDEVLKILAARLRQNVREVDILARYGGDEFVILLVENNQVSAKQVVERLKKAVNGEPFNTTQGPMPVSISLGMAPFTRDIIDLSTLIEKAGLDLHAVKKARQDHPSQ